MIQPVSVSTGPPAANTVAASRKAPSTAPFALTLAAVPDGDAITDATHIEVPASPADGDPRQDTADDGKDMPSDDTLIDPQLTWLTMPVAVPVAIPMPPAPVLAAASGGTGVTAASAAARPGQTPVAPAPATPAPTMMTAPTRRSATAPIAPKALAPAVMPALVPPADSTPVPAATPATAITAPAPAPAPFASPALVPITASVIPNIPIDTVIPISAMSVSPLSASSGPAASATPTVPSFGTTIPAALLARPSPTPATEPADPARLSAALTLAPLPMSVEPSALPAAAMPMTSAAPTPIVMADGVSTSPISVTPVLPTTVAAPAPVFVVTNEPAPVAASEEAAIAVSDPRAGPLPIALPDPARMPTATPAFQAFAGAMRAGWQEARPGSSRKDADSLLPASATVAAPLETVRHAIAATGAAQEQTLDTRREQWPAAMIDHIEALRDAADSTSSRIRVVPDALGTIDLSVKRDGDTLHVHFAAEQAATRAMLADAQPRLAEIAQSRGLTLGDTGIGGGSGGAAQQQPRGPAQPVQPRSNPAPARAKHTAAGDDTRIA